MTAAIIQVYRQNPLRAILVCALLFRLLAAVFSTGYGMHDDHFLTVEVAQSWIDGQQRGRWLPDETKPDASPSGHSFTYPGTMYFLFVGIEKIGITDPAAKMLLVRLLHALFSMLVVYWGYKIVRAWYNERTAEIAGWLLALYWFMPMMSVRNLIEVFCVPFLMWGIWILARNKDERALPFLWAGIVTAISFSVRFQTGTFIAGLGLAVLFRSKFVHTLLFGLGVLLSVGVLQGCVDYFIWHKPFGELLKYIDYNLVHSGEFPNGPWYNYILVVAGLLVPPVSLFMVFGFFRNWKKHLLIFLPVLAFFIFHSAFPNKQERFIFPALPFIIMAGIAGWQEFREGSAFWQKRQGLYKACWIFFIVVNSVLLCALTLSSSKKNRVDAMRYLSEKGSITCMVIEDGNNDVAVTMPRFYLHKQWPYVYDVTSVFSAAQLKEQIDKDHSCKPQYVLFMEERNLETRVAHFKEAFPQLHYETTIEPSFLDKVMHWLNPVNVNQTTVIYRID